MNKDISDKINNYGVILRFITPILIAMIGYLTISLIGDIKTELKEIKGDAKLTTITMVNHLEHHRILEISLAERLKCLELILDKLNKEK